MNMIAMDNQPFSIVEDQGFIELLAELEPRYVIPSTKFFNETMLPQAYDSLKLKISKELSNASSLSFTSDMWKNSKTNESYISLTAHWLNENFEFKHCVLHCREMEGEHNGLNICNYIKDILSDWDITLVRVHIFFARNI